MLMFRSRWGEQLKFQSDSVPKAQCPQREESRSGSNRDPSADQSSALPPTQTWWRGDSLINTSDCSAAHSCLTRRRWAQSRKRFFFTIVWRSLRTTEYPTLYACMGWTAIKAMYDCPVFKLGLKPSVGRCLVDTPHSALHGRFEGCKGVSGARLWPKPLRQSDGRQKERVNAESVLDLGTRSFFSWFPDRSPANYLPSTQNTALGTFGQCNA